jgi:hypothetical protein
VPGPGEFILFLRSIHVPHTTSRLSVRGMLNTNRLVTPTPPSQPNILYILGLVPQTTELMSTLTLGEYLESSAQIF